MKPDLSVSIGGLRLKNPVISASGTFGYGLEFAPFYDISRLGAVVVKGLSLAPTPGNPPGRIVETAAGMLNAIGLQNIGVERFIADVVPRLEDAGAACVANIYGKTAEEYEEVAERLSAVSSLSAIEVNASCPNVKEGGMAFGATAEGIAGLTARVRRRTDKPLWVKLSPNVSNIAAIAAAALVVANPLEIVVASSSQGKGILGVIDGSPPKGVETPSDRSERRTFLRKIGYTL